jgi:hypothetical protein
MKGAEQVDTLTQDDLSYLITLTSIDEHWQRQQSFDWQDRDEALARGYANSARIALQVKNKLSALMDAGKEQT